MAETDQPGRQDPVPAKPIRGRKRKRVLIILGVVICALVLSVLFLPKPVARYVIARQLDQMEIVHKGVESLDINLWEQEVTIGPLSFQRSNAVPGKVGQFSIKLSLASLFSRRAVVDHIIIDGVDLKIRRTRKGEISINGVALRDYMAKQDDAAAPAAEEKPWHAALEKLQLRDSRVTLDQEGAGDLAITIRRLDLTGFRTWEPEQPGKFDLDATVNGVAFKWLGEARPFADKITLAIDATVNDVEIAKIEKFSGPLGLERRGGILSSRFNHDISFRADGRIDWSTKGTVEIAKTDLAKAGQGNLRSELTNIDIIAKVAFQPEQEIGVTAGGTIVFDKGHAGRPNGEKVSIDRLTLAFPEVVANIANDGIVTATVKPRLVSDGIVIEGPAAVRIERLAMDLSTADISMGATALDLKVSGNTDLKGVSLAVAQVDGGSATDFTIGSLQIPVTNLTVSLDDGAPRWQTAFSVAIKDLIAQVGAGNDADIRLRTVTAENVKIDQTLGVAATALQLGGLNAKLTDKILPAAKSEEPDNVKQEKNTQDTTGGNSGLHNIDVAIDRLSLEDRGDIRFTDASVTPEVDFKLSLQKLELTKLDTANAAQKSGLILQAKINEFTDLNLSGWVAMFGPKPDFELKLKLKGMELPRFSPYVAKATGMHMESGQLNLDASASAKQAALDARLVVNLRNLELGEMSPEDAKKLAGAAGMPIQTAVGLLQDSDKVIDLQIPVHGTIAEPEIDLSDAIQKAVGGALASLFPPTAIASMLVSASKGGATFAPVPFREGTATLGDDGQAVAKSLTQLLLKRPKLALRVCGRSTFSDVERYKNQILAEQKIALDRARATKSPSQTNQKAAAKPGNSPSKRAPISVAEILASAKKPMAKLALDRTRALRAYLLTQNKDLQGRVSECRSVYDPKDKNVPRADVTF